MSMGLTLAERLREAALYASTDTQRKAFEALASDASELVAAAREVRDDAALLGMTTRRLTAALLKVGASA